MAQNEVEQLISKFDLESHGFYNIVPFNDGSLGFSARKDWGPNKKKGTLLSLYVYKNDPNSQDSEKKLLIVSATYGTIVGNEGVKIRSSPRLTEPADVDFRKEYFYNTQTGTVYRNNDEISPERLVWEVYSLHLKPTKFLKGFWFRIKMFFWKSFLHLLFEGISKIFYFLLYIASGDRYSYEPFYEEETYNGEIIKSRLRPVQLVKQRVELKKSKEVSFFNYNVKQWPIIVYCAIHITAYSTLSFIEYKPVFIATIFRNNFLTVAYVILSVWLFETVVPKVLMFFIRFFSKLSFKSEYKSITI